MTNNKKKPLSLHGEPGVEAISQRGCYDANSPELFPSRFYRGPRIDDFATSGKRDGQRFGIWDLAAAAPGNYKKIFQLCQVPRLEDIYGQQFNGLTLYTRYWQFGRVFYSLYVGRFRDVVTGKMFLLPFTFQKNFLEKDVPVKKGNKEGVVSGTNYWCRQGQVFLPFRVYCSPSFSDSSTDTLKIDYNVLPNKAFFKRPLIDEVKQIPGSDLYLGRMYFRFAGKHIPFLWFALERVQHPG